MHLKRANEDMEKFGKSEKVLVNIVEDLNQSLNGQKKIGET